MDRLAWRFPPWAPKRGSEDLDSLVMESRDRLANLGFFGAAAVVWLLVGLVVTTRDPVVDPGAGFIGALLIGLAVGLTLVPLVWLTVFGRHRQIAYTGRLAAGDPSLGVGGPRRGGPDRAPPAGPAPAADRAVHRRADDRRRGDALRGTLTRCSSSRARLGFVPVPRPDPRSTVLPALTAVQPAEPFADAKARLALAVEAARAEILDLSHRIHANPEPAFEEVQAATWVAETLRRHGFAVEHPAGSLATAIRAVRPGGRGGAGPRIGILAEYDALPGLGHGCGHNTMAASGWVPRSPWLRWPTSSPARSSSSARRRRNGAAASRS